MFESLVFSFVAGFVFNIIFIGLKAFQQLNVFHDKYTWVIPISFAMALCDIILTKLVVANSLWIALPVGLGGGLGCIASMYLHDKARKFSK